MSRLIERQFFDVVLSISMAEEIVVTREGQNTIQASLRAKYGIEEGTRLETADSGEGILFRLRKVFLELAGAGSKHASGEEMKKLLEMLREEYV